MDKLYNLALHIHFTPILIIASESSLEALRTWLDLFEIKLTDFHFNVSNKLEMCDELKACATKYITCN